MLWPEQLSKRQDPTLGALSLKIGGFSKLNFGDKIFLMIYNMFKII